MVAPRGSNSSSWLRSQVSSNVDAADVVPLAAVQQIVGLETLFASVAVENDVIAINRDAN